MLLLAALAAGAAVCTADTSRRELAATGIDVLPFIPKGWTRESISDLDLNGDGRKDLVVISRHPDNEARKMVAVVSTARGWRNVGEANLPGYPLGDAQVELNAKKVLVVTDLTGGTTANQTVMRYRYEGPSATQGFMRYIGLDITNYSRTNQHDSVELSFNWLTGAHSRVRNRLTKKGDYIPGKPVVGQGEPRCLGMEDTADPDDVMSAELDHGDKR